MLRHASSIHIASGTTQVPGTSLPSIDGISATTPTAMNASDSDYSTTHSGISGGTINITDEKKHQALTGESAAATIANLNRDVETGVDTTNALTPIFDKEEIERGFEITKAFTNEASTFLVNRAKEADRKKAEAEAAEKMAMDPSNGLSDVQRMALLNNASTLRDEAKEISADWGAGGTYRQITTALVAGASGNVTAGATEFLQNTVINYVQQQGAECIGDLVVSGVVKEGSPEHAALHALVGYGGPAASGQDCSAGALGGVYCTLAKDYEMLLQATNSNKQQQPANDYIFNRKNLIHFLSLNDSN